MQKMYMCKPSQLIVQVHHEKNEVRQTILTYDLLSIDSLTKQLSAAGFHRWNYSRIIIGYTTRLMLTLQLHMSSTLNYIFSHKTAHYAQETSYTDHNEYRIFLQQHELKTSDYACRH